LQQHSETVQSLNDLLQGEYMAVTSFNNFIHRVKNENVKSCFMDIQKQHRENIGMLAEYIQNIGGQPNENIGMKGKMGEIKINMDLGSKTDDTEIIEKALEGEIKGVNAAEKVLRGNLDDKSRDIAGEVLKKDRMSIEKLQNLMNTVRS